MTNQKDLNTQKAHERLQQIKQQLNLTPSDMSLQAPKDMANERAAASFDIAALSHFWMGGEDKYKRRVSFII
jgi:acyl-CoA oxidase